MKTSSLVILVSLLAIAARADVRLPALFSDHMVLQREMPVPVWGTATPGDTISVSFAGQQKTGEVAGNGTWKVVLDPLPACTTGKTLTITSALSNQKSEITNVLVGEVWLCSGQSNMQKPVGDQERSPVSLPQLRVFTEKSAGAAEPQKLGQGTWQQCSPETCPSFSGTAYFFGRNLHERLNLPVGLIVSAVGGTPIESWTSGDAQRTLPEMKHAFAKLDAVMATYDPVAAKAQKEKELAGYEKLVAKAKAEGKQPPGRPKLSYDPRASGPGNLFNGKIAPLMPFAIRGAVWYQGESNARTAANGRLYAKQLPLLIQDWRTRWGQGNFPFAWVQLPKFHGTSFAGWCEVRESMLKTLSLTNTGMAVTIDSGDPVDIHPKNKPEVGRRLALWALAKVYGQDISFSGPLPACHVIKGREVICTFTHAEGLASATGEITGFTLAGADKIWHPATARIQDGKVIVSSPEVKAPIALRYAWADIPEGNLVNAAGLPASPFRTDDWASPTAGTPPHPAVVPSTMFGDHMVLQREMPVPVWGTATPGDTISVSFAGQQKTGEVAGNGTWKIVLDPLPACTTGKTLTITSALSNQQSAISDVLVGEVWLCSGQSNMEYKREKVPELNALAAAAKTKPIRHYRVPTFVSLTPEESCGGKWSTGGSDSAVAFGFSYHLQQMLNVPVAVIVTCWGSSSIEGWMPLDMTARLPHFKAMMEQFETEDKGTVVELIERGKSSREGARAWTAKENVYVRRRPTILYNAMLHPLAPYACRGMVWYQGEANADRYAEYAQSFPLWLERLRKEWRRDDFHLLAVMLPGFGVDDGHPDGKKSWAWFREVQMKILELPHTSVANTIDLGDAKNIHPADKAPICERLALLACRDVYGMKISGQGPTYKSCSVKGRQLVVTFTHAAGLKTTDGNAPKGFWLAGKESVWQPAMATILGDTVVVEANGLETPVACRYAFCGKPEVNLVNSDNLPAYPFRTD